VTLLSGKKSVVGLKVSVDPPVVQVPGVAGVTTGNGVAVDKGADIDISIGPSLATAVDPSAGVVETTLSARAGATVVVLEEEEGEVVDVEVPELV
jgi:uncharacterized protein YqfA (UPF0365 family)